MFCYHIYEFWYSSYENTIMIRIYLHRMYFGSVFCALFISERYTCIATHLCCQYIIYK